MGAWEDERYWPFYLLYGRIGYAADTPPRVWLRAYRARYPEVAAAPLARGIEAASKILPLITAFHMPMHPMLVYWPELSTGGALFAEHNHNRAYVRTRHYGDVSYGSTEPSDPGLFYGINEYAHDRWRGTIQAKYTPLQVGDWLREYARSAQTAVAEADAALSEHGGEPEAGSEYRAARADILVLADLAAYHAAKIEAALSLALSRQADQANQQASAAAHLGQALRHMVAARERWVALAERGKAAYHDPLEFNAGHGTARRGTWADRTSELDADVARLEALLESVLAGGRIPTRRDEPESERQIETVAPPQLELRLPLQWPAGRDLPVEATLSGSSKLPSGLALHYRRTNQLEGAFRQIDMVHAAEGYRAVIPGNCLEPEWDLLVYVAAVLSEAQVFIHPGLQDAVSPLPYRIVRIVASKRA
jgi:hypothetical protein